MEKRKIKDLPVGKCRVTLWLRKTGKISVRGEIIVDDDGNKHFHTRNPKKRSFAPNTDVIWFRPEGR